MGCSWQLVPATVALLLSGCSSVEAPSLRECEAAINNVLRVEAADGVEGPVRRSIVGSAAPAIAVVTGERDRDLATCESEWNRQATTCLRTARTRDDIAQCRKYPWSDPVRPQTTER